MNLKNGIAPPPVKACMCSPLGGPKSPIVYFSLPRAPYTAAGYGIQISRNWIMTCEHVAAKSGPGHRATRAGMPVARSRPVLGIVIMGGAGLVFPDRFREMFDHFKHNVGVENERLTLVRLGGDSDDAAQDIEKVEFVEAKRVFKSVQFGTISLDHIDGLSCAVVGVSPLVLERGSGSDSGLYTAFTNVQKLAIRRGDSGGVFIDANRSDGKIGIVAVHHALAWDDKGDVANRGIPMNGVSSWFSDVVAAMGE